MRRYVTVLCNTEKQIDLMQNMQLQIVDIVQTQRKPLHMVSLTGIEPASYIATVFKTAAFAHFATATNFHVR